MSQKKESDGVKKLITELSSPFNYNNSETAIILAAGHGKRIKSRTSKMLHKIWEIPTVERVYNACKNAIRKLNVVVVVGVKAEDVISVIAKRNHCIFSYQKEQKGTGHAVLTGLKAFNSKNYNGIVYIFPGDMGLIDKESILRFRASFKKSNSDMMVLTGVYEEDPYSNYYGRIIRVKEFDLKGDKSPDSGKVIEIKEWRDILALPNNKPYIAYYKGRSYSYSKEELIKNNEFNSGVFAFKSKPLVKYIAKIKSDNAQKEIYITDLISLFNKNNLTVSAATPKDQTVLMGFNDKSTLLEMEAIARRKAYDKLKDIIEISAPDDFFIDETVISDILEMDKKGIPLDIKIGKGVYIGKGVKVNYNLNLKKNVFVTGNVIFGKNNTVWENGHLSCYQGQRFVLGDNVEILWGNIIKGNIIIGDYARIESSVNMTGSDEFPLRIGKNVLIKGTSYIFGSIIEDDIFIEHSILIKKKIERLSKKDGTVQKVRYYLPMPEGIDAVENI